MPDSEWLSRMKVTMAVDVGRFMAAGYPPKAIVEKLFAIPEVREAFELRERAVRDRKGKWSLPEEK